MSGRRIQVMAEYDASGKPKALIAVYDIHYRA